MPGGSVARLCTVVEIQKGRSARDFFAGIAGALIPSVKPDRGSSPQRILAMQKLLEDRLLVWLTSMPAIHFLAARQLQVLRSACQRVKGFRSTDR